MIAEVTGLSGTTVVRIRAQCPIGQSGQLDELVQNIPEHCADGGLGGDPMFQRMAGSGKVYRRQTMTISASRCGSLQIQGALH
jgi:hypothetical protein